MRKAILCALGTDSVGTGFTLSNWSNRSVKDVALATPNLLKFQNIYIFDKHEVKISVNEICKV